MKRIALILLLASPAAFAADSVVLDNDTVALKINLHGGSISSYAFKDEPLNPFTWHSWHQADHPEYKEGFFLCFDRIGKSSEEEQVQGFPFHGEAASTRWQVVEHGTNSLRMRCDLPRVNMSVVREYTLFTTSSVCRIRDRFINNNPFEKEYNILQHPFLAAPFLDESVLIDCNADAGFFNIKKLDELPIRPAKWPEVETAAGRIDLRRMVAEGNMVVNYRSAPGVTLGWGCIANPGKGLLVGTLWQTDEYPWYRVCRAWKDGVPDVVGIEFGTSPLGMPFAEIRQVGDLLGQPTLHTLPPGGEVHKTFHLFLSKIPTDYTGIKHIRLEKDRLVLEEKTATREITLNCSSAR